MQVITKAGQWLGDVALAASGSIEAIVEMAIAGNLSITGEVAPATSLTSPTAVDSKVAAYYKFNGIFPATGEDQEYSTGGIGAMAIEINFIVS